MLQKDERREDSMGEEVAELNRKIESSRKELGDLVAELEHCDTVLEEETERLTSFNRQYAVSLRKMKTIESEIHYLKEKRSEIGSEICFLQEEVVAKESEVSGLTDENPRLDKKIAGIHAKTNHLLESQAVLDTELQELLSSTEGCEARKVQLSEEISQRMPKISVKRKQIESDLTDLSQVFVTAVNELAHVQQVLSKTETALARRREAVQSLEDTCAQLKELKALQEERSVLKIDIQNLCYETGSNRKEIEELQGQVAEKQREFDTISKANADREAQITLLQQEVGRFDECALAFEKAEREIAESAMLSEQALARVTQVLEENAGISMEVRLMQEKTKIIFEAMGGIVG